MAFKTKKINFKYKNITVVNMFEIGEIRRR